MAISQGQWQMATALLTPRASVIGVMAGPRMFKWQAVIGFNLTNLIQQISTDFNDTHSWISMVHSLQAAADACELSADLKETLVSRRQDIWLASPASCNSLHFGCQRMFSDVFCM